MKTTLILVFLLTIGFVCRVKSGQGCGNNPADVVFVLDESGSIYGPDFRRQLDFVQNTIDTFDVQFNRTHVGVLTFSTDTRDIFNLGEYTDEAALKKAVKEIKQRRGDTYTHLALKRLRENLFSPQYSRSWVRHVAIVITDGESNYPEKTKAESELLHKTDLQVFAIGVGPSVVVKELETIASAPDLVFKVEKYEALETLRLILASKACETPSTAAPPPTTTTTTTTKAPTPAPVKLIEGCTGQKVFDHIWSISDQAGVEETNLAIDFIKSVTTDMVISPNRIQVGLAPRFCDEVSGIRLKDHDTGSGFRVALDKRRLSGIRTERTIEYIRREGYSSSNGGRSESVRFGILIIDNRLENWEQALEEAERAKKEGIQLFVIGVGDRIQEDQLRQLSSSTSHYFYASSYLALADLKTRIIQKFCAAATIVEKTEETPDGNPEKPDGNPEKPDGNPEKPDGIPPCIEVQKASREKKIRGITAKKFNLNTLRGYLEQF